MKGHDVDYEILGHDLQMVEVELDPGETVVAEAGAMNYMEDGMTFEARMGGRILAHASSGGGSGKEEGSLPGRFGGMLRGD